VTGRFVSEDQKHDGINWFEYVHSAPTMRVDYSGHFLALIEFILGVLIVCAFVGGFKLGEEAGERGRRGMAEWGDGDSAGALCGGVMAAIYTGKWKIGIMDAICESLGIEAAVGLGAFMAGFGCLVLIFAMGYMAGFRIGVDRTSGDL
jgi:hypothetical protein